MGTRNITRVISDKGAIVVNQYCQWDGYPTGRGAEVMLFVNKYCRKENIDEFKRRINESALFMAVSNQDACCYLGAHWNKTVGKLSEMEHDMKYRKPGSIFEFVGFEKLIEDGTITEEEYREYLQASRNAGPKILYWLMEHEENGMAFYTDDYCYRMTIKGDWQIEGVFIIDLSKNKVTIGYHGKRRTYSFEKVCAMTETEIEAEMEKFEAKD